MKLCSRLITSIFKTNQNIEEIKGPNIYETNKNMKKRFANCRYYILDMHEYKVKFKLFKNGTFHVTGTKSVEQCDEVYKVLLETINFNIWNPSKHHIFPDEFKNIVLTLLLVNKRYNNILYKDVIHLIIQQLAWKYIPYKIVMVSTFYKFEKPIKDMYKFRGYVEDLISQTFYRKIILFKNGVTIISKNLKENRIRFGILNKLYNEYQK